VGVAGAFDVPFGHLAFDEAGVGAWSSAGVEAAAELGEGVTPGPFNEAGAVY
jgi:hypothetical protein